MMDLQGLSEEIARLDKTIEFFEVQLNEIRQQREFKMALLRQLQEQEDSYFNASNLVHQRTDVISE